MDSDTLSESKTIGTMKVVSNKPFRKKRRKVPKQGEDVGDTEIAKNMAGSTAVCRMDLKTD